MITAELTDTFFESLRALDRADGRRVVAFLGKLLTDPDAARLQSEIVHDAHDHAVRSYRVTQDMRAITETDADRLFILFVGRHDRAYAWARGHCFDCLTRSGERHVVVTPQGQSMAAPQGTAAIAGEDVLAGVLEERGLGALLR